MGSKLLRCLVVLLMVSLLACSGTGYKNKAECPYKKSCSKCAKSGHPAPISLKDICFQKVAHNMGYWKGYVQGNGLTKLSINFIKDNRVILSKSMGRVELNRNEKPVSFHFKTTLPENYDSWQIISN